MPRVFLSYLKLVRLPNVFSALADIVAGFFIADEMLYDKVPGLKFPAAGPGKLALLCAASACLYLAGMAFNDIADLKEDRRYRPERPIPSGAVTLGGAVLCAVLLMLAGLNIAFLCGLFSLEVAALLALAILAYDFICKQRPLAGLLGLPGPAALGCCRGANMLLGMSATAGVAQALQSAQPLSYLWLPILASGFFGAAVTAFSAQEETGKKISALVLGWVCMLAAFAAALFGAVKIFGAAPAYRQATAGLLLGSILWQLISRSKDVLREGTPKSARMLVLAGLKGYCPLDAALLLMFAGSVAPIAAAVVVVLLFPGAWLRTKLAQWEA